MGCPHCERVQVVDVSAQRSLCRSCNGAFRPFDRKKFYVGEDASAAREAAARISLEVGKAPPLAAEEARRALERERALTLQDVVDELRQKPEFVLADVEDALLRSCVSASAAQVVESLRQSDRLYEPRPGRYRWIP